MIIGKRTGTATVVALATLALIVTGAGSATALSKQELKCTNAVGKAASKLSKTRASSIGKCKDADISGKAPGACPDASGLAKIAKAETKLGSAIDGGCVSACSASNSISCIDNNTCPPLPTSNEQCSGAGGSNPFRISNLGFPGPFCEAKLGAPLLDTGDVTECVQELGDEASDALLDVIYGSLGSSSVSADAAGCLAAISKASQKLSAAIYKGVIKCRGAIASGKVVGDPATCRFDDPKIVAKVDKAAQKLTDTITDKCNNLVILELDLCGNGVSGTLSTGDANTCLLAAINEVTDTDTNPSLRTYAPISLVDAAYPPNRAVCGDGLINQDPNPFALLGEECEEEDDSACPGDCLPPGDLYECTCATRALVRFVADGLTADLDSGWTGTSHQSGVADRAGYINELINCDCDALTGATCTGSTGDPICDVEGFQLPTCSWDALSNTRCDDHGNNDSSDKNLDCNRCDAFNVNVGDFCVNEGGCQAQCYNSMGMAVGLCDQQSDCGSGEVCRGQCDDSATCIIIPNGAPLPISSGGTPVCIGTVFREDVFGTRNIVTGEHEVYLQQYSVIRLGVTNALPCPVCGGFCTGGPLAGEMCEGRCSGSGDTCRFDTDCPVSETCSSTTPDCPSGSCNLALVCGGGLPSNPTAATLSAGQPCRLEAYTTQFGTTSNDCLPATGNISGDGLEINFYPTTSETVDLPAVMPCTTPGYELFDCPCPQGTNSQKRPTAPNTCAGACNAGAEFGIGCGTGANNISGEITSCSAGINVNRACDEDGDCPGGLCDDNPTHCVGGAPVDELKLCATNAECSGGGTCTDACPSGRCQPLCLPGAYSEAEEGYCASGPDFYHCSAAADTFRTCTQSQAEGSCLSVCATTCGPGGIPSGGSATPCDGTTACPGAETCCGACTQAQTCGAGTDGIYGTSDDIPGAGICIADIRNCFANDLAAEGGDTLNGDGDPTNVDTVSTYCVAPTGNGAVNQTAGLGGPGRLRQQGVLISNKPTIP